VLRWAILLLISTPCWADEPLQVTCTWSAPGTTPVNSYTLYELNYGANRFSGAAASLSVAGLGAGLNPVLSGIGAVGTEAPAVALHGLHPQQFFDEGVRYVRTYSLARNSDGAACGEFDDTGSCHFVTKVSFVIDTCARPLPLIVLFPTGAGAACVLQKKTAVPIVSWNSPLPWETTAPSAFLNGWTVEQERAQRGRCN
jgi:hypothetical protein